MHFYELKQKTFFIFTEVAFAIAAHRAQDDRQNSSLFALRKCKYKLNLTCRAVARQRRPFTHTWNVCEFLHFLCLSSNNAENSRKRASAALREDKFKRNESAAIIANKNALLNVNKAGQPAFPSVFHQEGTTLAP